MIATNRKIDSVWTMEYNILDNDKIEVISYSRDNPVGYEEEKSHPRFDFEETDGRVVVNAMIDNHLPKPLQNWYDRKDHTVYEIDNKQNIFSYGLND